MVKQGNTTFCSDVNYYYINMVNMYIYNIGDYFIDFIFYMF